MEGMRVLFLAAIVLALTGAAVAAVAARGSAQTTTIRVTNASTTSPSRRRP
jgi:hypothetical protein